MININHLTIACFLLLLTNPPILQLKSESHSPLNLSLNQILKIMLIVAGGYFVFLHNEQGLTSYFSFLFLISYILELINIEQLLIDKNEVGISFIIISGIILTLTHK